MTFLGEDKFKGCVGREQQKQNDDLFLSLNTHIKSAETIFNLAKNKNTESVADRQDKLGH